MPIIPNTAMTIITFKAMSVNDNKNDCKETSTLLRSSILRMAFKINLTTFSPIHKTIKAITILGTSLNSKLWVNSFKEPHKDCTSINFASTFFINN